LYMMQKWMRGRCACEAAPLCTKGNLALLDRLYYNKYDIVGHMCRNKFNMSAIPRHLVRKVIQEHEEQTRRSLAGHPRFLHYRLEDNMTNIVQKLADFLGLELEVPSNISFHENKAE